MFDARMRTTLAQRLVSIASSVFDQTCFNPLTGKFEGHQTFHQKRKTVLLFAYLLGDVLFLWTAARMRTTLVKRLVSIVSYVCDQTCFNRLATHFNISMFGHQQCLMVFVQALTGKICYS